MPDCSVIIPVYNRAWLTRQVLETVLENGASTIDFEIIVVDDASTDVTSKLLSDYAGCIRTVQHTTNTGFARACNDGADLALGQYLVFLNNDTIPSPGWLDALVGYAEAQSVAVVGSKLLYANGTVQHAGVVIGQDRCPRHLYVGFPGEHAAVNKSRRFQAVTAACMLVRREAFEHAGGFDTVYRNGYEDIDLCLRLRTLGYEIHYCHESVVYHLESVSAGRMDWHAANTRTFFDRWYSQIRPDDLEYYLADGLIQVTYPGSYPIQLQVSPMLATTTGPQREAALDELLQTRSQHVLRLLKENIRVAAELQEARFQAAMGGAQNSSSTDR